MKYFLAFCLFVIGISGCSTPSRGILSTQPTPALNTAAPKPTSTVPSPQPALAERTVTVARCQPARIIVPTKPAVIPGTAELDETTGLHMTGTVQEIDIATYRLSVSGKVDHPLSLSYDELRCMTKVTGRYTLICPETFEDEATWSGVPLKTILDMAGLQPDANNILLKGADGYNASVSMRQALKPDNFLAYEWEGQPLPILHGFPIRAVLPGVTGGLWVKWLAGIEVE